MGWVGVDLDGTLAMYETWKGPTHIGPPIPAMVKRVQRMLERGIEVKIFTARVSTSHEEERLQVTVAIQNWCLQVFGRVLPVTNCKDFAMIALFDDRCITVEPNTGNLLTPGVFDD